MKTPPRPSAADRPAPPNPHASPPGSIGQGRVDLQHTEKARPPATSHIAQMGLNGDELFVTFKDEVHGGETEAYVYSFPSPGEAAAVYEEMRSSPHPFGAVLYPEVIQGGIPFHKQ